MQVGEEGLVSCKREEGRRVCSVGEVWSVMQVAVGVCMVSCKMSFWAGGKERNCLGLRFGLDLS